MGVNEHLSTRRCRDHDHKYPEQGINGGKSGTAQAEELRDLLCRVLADTAQLDELQARAQVGLARIEASGAVDPRYFRIRADVDPQPRWRQEELERLAREALERVRDTSCGKRRRPPRLLPHRCDPKSHYSPSQNSTDSRREF